MMNPLPGQIWKLNRASPTDLFADVVILGYPQYEDVPTVDVAPFSHDLSLAGPNDHICILGAKLSSMDFSLPIAELYRPIADLDEKDYLKSSSTMSENLFALHETIAGQIMELQELIYIWLDENN